MATSSYPTYNVTDAGLNEEIERHNRTLPLTSEEIVELLRQPSLAEQFKEMQERIQALEANNKELRGRLQAKKVTLWSTVVIPNEEPSHLSGKEPMEQEPRIKKSRKHAKDRYERETEGTNLEGYQANNEKNSWPTSLQAREAAHKPWKIME